ncbi:dipeptidase PepV [Metabacillus arenae]|uniref:Dipeptidase PepV n=1 Tax=Metabacillus arenae TaxID=2771434 RepID=A0A926RWR3_9BACI|nr:dipeptidase PepV [Metabacillus arenae]MBD1380191.1 dipeptidase PepV [Metabacillus arenae]
MKWMDEVLIRKEQLLKDTHAFLQIKSVLDENDSSHGAPFGKGIQEALEFLLQKGEEEGFAVKNVDGYAGHIEMGQGEELVGVLCHVDVVPEGDGWSSDPYGAEIREGNLYARGAIDDKGPTMAAYYAMKIVKEMGLSLNKRVRIIIGTDEESDWRCVDHYFKHEEMPTIGFAPDADFPIIYAEKGIIDAKLRYIPTHTYTESTGYILTQFQSGRRLNMVPDFAQARCEGTNLNAIKTNFESYLSEMKLKGKADIEGTKLKLTLEGASAHAMEPNNGKNAGLLLAAFLEREQLDDAAQAFINQLADLFIDDTRGKKVGVSCEDDITGELTLNVGIMNYEKVNGGELGINIRYPVKGDSSKIKAILEKIEYFELTSFNDSKPHHVDQNHSLIKTLQKVYEEQTGDKAKLLSIGGGTYARSLEAGVAFGPLFPERPDVAHQKDEYIVIDDLVKATAIYAQAIYELAK